MSSSLKVIGVVLAAGRSTRMGRTKQLLAYRGRPLLQHVLDSAAQAVQLDRLLLLLGHRASEIRESLELRGADVVFVPDFRQGQSASMRGGVEEAQRLGANAVLFLLGDQPLVSAEVMDRVAAAYREHGNQVVLPVCGGKRGNPVLMDRGLFPQLLEISGDVGGRAILSRYEGAIREVEVSCPGIHADVDQWDDYERLP
ncbi:MAG: nucleotidyltransferase family protein [Desulfohalobiaceae bacterium]